LLSRGVMAVASLVLAGFSSGVISLDLLYAATAVFLALLCGVWLALERRVVA